MAITTVYMNTVSGKPIHRQGDATPIVSWLRDNLPMHKYGKWKTKLDREVDFRFKDYPFVYMMSITFEREQDVVLFRMFWADDIKESRTYTAYIRW